MCSSKFIDYKLITTWSSNISMCKISSSILALTTVRWPHIPTVEVSHPRQVSNREAIRVRDFKLPPRYRSGRRSSGMSQRMLVVAYRRFGTEYRPFFKCQGCLDG